MSKRHYMDNLTPVAQNIWKTDDGLFMFSIDGFEINDPCHVSILDTDGSSYVDIPGATKNFQGLRAAVEWGVPSMPLRCWKYWAWRETFRPPG